MHRTGCGLELLHASLVHTIKAYYILGDLRKWILDTSVCLDWVEWNGCEKYGHWLRRMTIRIGRGCFVLMFGVIVRIVDNGLPSIVLDGHSGVRKTVLTGICIVM